ncbi:hypothetical protein DTO271G3_3219 [Paecilomyces variotii]|nr:hypothetical protein DTO271G3_3219 [Paecilomyces variotii]
MAYNFTKKFSNLRFFLCGDRRRIANDDYEGVRRKVLGGLNDLYAMAFASDDEYVTTSGSSGFRIQYEDLILEDVDGQLTADRRRFFLPCSYQFLEEHPVITTGTSAIEETRVHEKVLVSSDELKNHPIKSARFLCTWLGLNFSEYWRANGIICGMIVTDEGFLLYGEFAGLVDEEFKDAVLQDRTPMEAWRIPGDYPHLMLTVAHKSDGRREYLLRGELLTIAAVMISRLRSQRFAQHTVIPVMLFSFMGEKKGRIILAHTNSRALVIRKSKLYDFSTVDNFRKFTTLFLRYMTCDAIGNTREIC